MDLLNVLSLLLVLFLFGPTLLWPCEVYLLWRKETRKKGWSFFQTFADDVRRIEINYFEDHLRMRGFSERDIRDMIEEFKEFSRR